MGEVLLARVRGVGGFERHVVLKTIDLSGDDRTQMQAMFLDEARVLGRLHHQHIAPVFEINEDGDKLYLVIDYVHGRTAQEVWQQAIDVGAPLPFDFGLTVVAHAASGLHYAHTRSDDAGQPLQIVHRDVSLSNLMVGYDGAVKLIDFGIAKAANRRSKTQTGFVKGKLGYMAPEQLRQQDVDARTDVFALGIVLYELTTMVRPFRDQSDRMTAERIKSGAFRKPSQLIAGYPPELEWIVNKALQVDPRERFDSADAMRRAIDALGHRYDLVLGDTAIACVMTQLFDERREPWRLIDARPQTELDVATVDVLDDAPPRPFKKPMRSATEIVEALANELEQPSDEIPRGEFDEQAPTATAPARAATATVEEAPMIPAASTNPPSSEDRVASIRRLFTESTFDPSETPRPLDSIAETPPRMLTQRGVGLDERATTDGVQLLPPSVPIAPAVAAKSWAMTMFWIMAGLIAAGVIGIVIYTFAIQSDEPDAEPVVVVVVVADSGTVDVATVAPDARTMDAPAGDAELVADAVVATAPPDAASPDAGRTITLKLTSIPTAATVVLDGKRLGKTPFDAPVELVGPGPHAIKIRLTGYNTVKVDLDGDLEREVTLTKARPKPEAPKEPAPGGLEILD